MVNEHATVGSEVAYAYANFTQDGLVLLRARILETTLTPLVVWDGTAVDGRRIGAAFAARTLATIRSNESP